MNESVRVDTVYKRSRACVRACLTLRCVLSRFIRCFNFKRVVCGVGFFFRLVIETCRAVVSRRVLRKFKTKNFPLLFHLVSHFPSVQRIHCFIPFASSLIAAHLHVEIKLRRRDHIVYSHAVHVCVDCPAVVHIVGSRQSATAVRQFFFP